MNRLVVGVIWTMFLVASTTMSYADGVIIPRSTKVEVFKEEMKEVGMNFYGGDDADGEVQNLGNQIKVITYRPVTVEQLDLIRNAAIKAERK